MFRELGKEVVQFVACPNSLGKDCTPKGMDRINIPSGFLILKMSKDEDWTDILGFEGPQLFQRFFGKGTNIKGKPEKMWQWTQKVLWFLRCLLCPKASSLPVLLAYCLFFLVPRGFGFLRGDQLVSMSIWCSILYAHCQVGLDSSRPRDFEILCQFFMFVSSISKCGMILAYDLSAWRCGVHSWKVSAGVSCIHWVCLKMAALFRK